MSGVVIVFGKEVIGVFPSREAAKSYAENAIGTHHRWRLMPFTSADAYRGRVYERAQHVFGRRDSSSRSSVRSSLLARRAALVKEYHRATVALQANPHSSRLAIAQRRAADAYWQFDNRHPTLLMTDLRKKKK